MLHKEELSSPTFQGALLRTAQNSHSGCGQGADCHSPPSIKPVRGGVQIKASCGPFSASSHPDLCGPRQH